MSSATPPPLPPPSQNNNESHASSSWEQSNPYGMNYNNVSSNQQNDYSNNQQTSPSSSSNDDVHASSWGKYNNSSFSSSNQNNTSNFPTNQQNNKGFGNEGNMRGRNVGGGGTTQLSCLYTKHKTQKRKVWNDGRLVLRGCRACIHDANPPPGSTDASLDETELTMGQVQAVKKMELINMETEKFLVTIEGPWVAVGNNNKSLGSGLEMGKGQKVMSSGMQKLLKSKFKKPGTGYVPPHPMERKRNMMMMSGGGDNSGGGRGMGQQGGIRRRRAPLQPGELEKRYYGDGAHDMMPGARGTMPSRPPIGGYNGNIPPDIRGGGQGGDHGEYSNARGTAMHQHQGYDTSNRQRRPGDMPQPHHHLNANDKRYPSSQDQNDRPCPNSGPNELYNSNGQPMPPSLHNKLGENTKHYANNLTNKKDSQNQRNQQQNSKKSRFSSNEFDPSGFYGEEEDDDDDDDDSSEEEENEDEESSNDANHNYRNIQNQGGAGSNHLNRGGQIGVPTQQQNHQQLSSSSSQRFQKENTTTTTAATTNSKNVDRRERAVHFATSYGHARNHDIEDNQIDGRNNFNNERQGHLSENFPAQLVGESNYDQKVSGADERGGGEEKSTNNGLSKDDLLQLFGAGSSSPDTKSTRSSINGDTASSNDLNKRQHGEDDNNNDFLFQQLSGDVSQDEHKTRANKKVDDNNNKEKADIDENGSVSKRSESNPFLAQLMRADAEVDRRTGREKGGSESGEDERGLSWNCDGSSDCEEAKSKLWNDDGNESSGNDDTRGGYDLDEYADNFEGLTGTSVNSQSQLSDRNQERIKKSFVDQGLVAGDGKGTNKFSKISRTEKEANEDCRIGFILPSQSDSSSDDDGSSDGEDSSET